MTEASGKQKDRKGQSSCETTVDRRIELGEMMRMSRENSGYSIERVATATRISYPFIEALESGQLQKLPAEAFSRGFIRNLCKVYNEDPKPMLQAFEIALRGDQRLKANYQADSLQPKVRQESRLFPSIGLTRRLLFSKPIQRLKSAPYPIYLAGIAVLVVSMLVGWFAWRNDGFDHLMTQSGKLWQDVKTSSIESSMPASTTPSVEAVDHHEQEVHAVAVNDDTEDQAIAKEMEKKALAAEGNWIELQVKKRVQVMIERDGQGWSNETLEPESYQYRFQDVLQVVLGNPESVDITFNGKPLAQSGQGGPVRRITFRNGKSEEVSRQ
ncbi:MAG: RodZ domain-containing protein [Oligoflexus sp.]